MREFFFNSTWVEHFEARLFLHLTGNVVTTTTVANERDWIWFDASKAEMQWICSWLFEIRLVLGLQRHILKLGRAQKAKSDQNQAQKSSLNERESRWNTIDAQN